MGDKGLRELELRFAQTGSVEDEVAYLRASVRAGRLSTNDLELAAYLGSPAAKAAAQPGSPPPASTHAWLRGLSAFGRSPTVEASKALREFERAPEDSAEELAELSRCLDAFLATPDTANRRSLSEAASPEPGQWLSRSVSCFLALALVEQLSPEEEADAWRELWASTRNAPVPNSAEPRRAVEAALLPLVLAATGLAHVVSVEFEVRPFEGIFPLRLGMTPEDVEQVMLEEGLWVRGTPRTPFVRVDYGEHGRAECIYVSRELGRPATFQSADGVDVFGVRAERVLAAIAPPKTWDEVHANWIYYRSTALELELERRVLPDLPGVVRGVLRRFGWRDDAGFFQGVAVAASGYWSHSAELTRACLGEPLRAHGAPEAPKVSRWTLESLEALRSAVGVAEVAAELRASPRLGASLDLGDRASEWLEGIRGLEAVGGVSLSAGQLTPDALAALSTLPNLIRLHIEDAPSASNWFECAMAHKALRRLTLCRTGLSDNALPRLLELHELRDLDLGYNDLLSSQALGTLSQLKNLRRLCLHGTRADDATVEALCSLPNLESLELDHCPITDASATRILALPTIRDASAHECEHVCLEAKSSLRRLSGTSW